MSPEYLAGFFDGEGCIGIHQGKRGQVLRITIANSDRGIMREICEEYGGNWYCHEYQDGQNYKNSYRVTWTGASAEEFLREIVSFLKVKRRQAELALEYRESMRSPSRLRYGNCLSLEAAESDREFKKRMHALNRKGLRIVGDPS